MREQTPPIAAANSLGMKDEGSETGAGEDRCVEKHKQDDEAQQFRPVKPHPNPLPCGRGEITPKTLRALGPPSFLILGAPASLPARSWVLKLAGRDAGAPRDSWGGGILGRFRESHGSRTVVASIVHSQLTQPSVCGAGTTARQAAPTARRDRFRWYGGSSSGGVRVAAAIAVALPVRRWVG